MTGFCPECDAPLGETRARLGDVPIEDLARDEAIQSQLYQATLDGNRDDLPHSIVLAAVWPMGSKGKATA